MFKVIGNIPCVRKFPLNSLPFFALLFLPTDDLFAKAHSLVCENSRQQYLVVFDDRSNVFVVNPDTTNTRYRVLAVERTDTKFIIVGLTTNDGPTFRAHFGPYKKIEYYVGDELYQTDGCH
jgi:hypothetical protein